MRGGIDATRKGNRQAKEGHWIGGAIFEGVQIKEWGQWSEQVYMGSKSGEGRSISPPPLPHLPPTLIYKGGREEQVGGDQRRESSLTQGITEMGGAEDT